MASHEFQSLRALLPSVLARLARERGDAGGLANLWREMAGPGLARAASPIRVEGATLLVRPVDATWARELDGHLETLGDRARALTHGEIRTVRLAQGDAA